MTDLDSARSPRFTQWMAFFVFATITMGATIEASNSSSQQDEKATRYESYAKIVTIVTFSVTALIVLLHLNGVTSLFIVGTKLEGLVCIILAGLWAATVAIVSNPRHGIALDENNGIINGNIYYFSWAGFVCSVTLLVSYLRSAFHVDITGEMKNRSARLSYWSALLAASLVVMGASASIYDEECANGGVGSIVKCRRTKFGIGLGAAGTIMSLAIVGMKIATARAPFLIEALFSFLLLICNAFGVSYITSHQGPGAPLGNLYYFSWIAFLSTFMLCASCLEDYNAAKAMSGDASGGPGVVSSPEIQVENMDDTI